MKYYLLGFLTLIVFTSSSYAYDVMLRLTINPPYSPYISDYNLYQNFLTITNLTGQLIEIKLEVKVEALINGGSVIFKANDNLKSITLNPNETRYFNGFELKDIIDFKTYDQEGINIDTLAIINGGLIPEDNYRICVTAYDKTGEGDPVSLQSCFSFIISYPDPPLILNPVCDDTVNVLQPQGINFQWSFATTPIGVVPADLRYVIKLVEVIDETGDPNDVMNNETTPLFFEKQILNGPFYIYGPNDPQLIPGHKYAAQIIVSDYNNRIVFKNGGKSEVCAFTYQIEPTIRKNLAIADAEKQFYLDKGIYSSSSAHELFTYFNPEMKNMDSITADYEPKFLELPVVSSEKLKAAKAQYDLAMAYQDSDQILLKNNLDLTIKMTDRLNEAFKENTGDEYQKIRELSMSLDSLSVLAHGMFNSQVAFRKVEADYINAELYVLNVQLQDVIDKKTDIAGSIVDNNIELSRDVAGFLQEALPQREERQQKKKNKTHGPYSEDYEVIYLAKDDPISQINLEIWPYSYDKNKEKPPTVIDSFLYQKIVKIVPFNCRNFRDEIPKTIISRTSPASVPLRAAKYYMRFYAPDGITEIDIMGGEVMHTIDPKNVVIRQKAKNELPVYKLYVPLKIH